MKYWTIIEPLDNSPESEPKYTTLSEAEIIVDYFSYWYGSMCQKFGQEQVDDMHTAQDCINDWAIVHWARPTDQNGNNILI